MPPEPTPPGAPAAVIRHAPFGCVLVEGDVIRDANTEAASVIGVPRDRLVGTSLTGLLMPDFEPVLTTLLAGVGAETSSARVRLARALAPIEIRARAVEGGTAVVALRSLDSEHHYSAMAGGDLTHDPVTGFPNRYHLLSLLDQRIRAVPRNPLALICLWIDDLPTLVTSRGEQATERVVREVGLRIQARLRSPDLLGRFDDAGFLGLLGSDAPAAQLTDIADRLRAEVAFPVELDSDLVSFTASVAVTSIRERRPTIERIIGRLEALAKRVTTGEGALTEILEF